MSPTVNVTVLVENSAHGARLLGEHGLSYWVEANGHAILFDTGQGMALEHNARVLGIDLAKTEAVVLSHGHFDHTGGLPSVFTAAPQARIYAHTMAFEPKFTRGNDGSVREIGIPEVSLHAAQGAGTITWTTHPTEILPGLWVTGPVPRENAFEDTGGPFFIEASCRVRDPLEDDQALFFDTDQGTVVLLGCAHAGIVNTLSYIRSLTEDRPIAAVLGGMHLLSASPERIAHTVEYLAALGKPRLGPAHCTGLKAFVGLWSTFPEQCVPCGAGTRMEFNRSISVAPEPSRAKAG
ncbi:MAG: MBL fold metallo-hydrolase [FCB group bacterium]|jgi:7,8-dihydropterin-6-yl-methyl-4-(beta-D-ribofuranosyl)aminobenzene 5'-phosphate synthase|nr:MBL fold metallo-hydrolase [FCB group bacterium]